MNLFRNKEKYDICRKMAGNSAIDVLDVAKAWCQEFYRLRDKVNKHKLKLIKYYLDLS
jgi:hypothetical protein